ncbi:helix-turn-helix domain-containing protein [Confluentibacter sediminis]|uniref:helix-turn-helix domain-containing protein n=1 Tax=Confluentibacter sediminis TaxID=2219045 RepID=UPI000DADFBC3|nr:helix-turn-helix transcriptional regulator [Confluentibacter sediminis]
MEYTSKEKLLGAIGKRIQEQRMKEGLEPEDVAEMTGLTAPTIRNIENGSETYFYNFIAICLAINMHPKDILDIELVIKPLNELSEPRKEKTRLTARIHYFIENHYFEQERTAKDVLNELAANYETQTTTSAISVILNRKVVFGDLKTKKKGKIKVYKSR